MSDFVASESRRLPWAHNCVAITEFDGVRGVDDSDAETEHETAQRTLRKRKTNGCAELEGECRRRF